MMITKKYVFVTAIILSIILILQFAEAGWIGRLFGNDPDLAPVNVNITLGNSPPFIVKYFTIAVPGLSQPFTPTAGGVATGYVGFVAQDPNGASDLPNMVGAPITGIVGGGVGAPINSPPPANSIVVSLNICTSYDCTTGAPGPPGQFFACDTPQLANQKAYICNFPVFYFNPPSLSTTNANDLWRINIGIFDLGGGTGTPAVSPTVISGQPGFGNVPNDYMQINALSAYNVPNGTTINWTALSLTAPNQTAGGPIVVQNYGNVKLNTTQITGLNLVGVNNPTAILNVSAFSASNRTGGIPPAAAECNVPATATQLNNNITTTITNVVIPYTSTGALADSDNIYFCAYKPLNTPGILTGTAISFTGIWQLIAF